MAAKFELEEQLSIRLAPPQKGPLDLLELRGDVSGPSPFLLRCTHPRHRKIHHTFFGDGGGIELYGMLFLWISKQQKRT